MGQGRRAATVAPKPAGLQRGRRWAQQQPVHQLLCLYSVPTRDKSARALSVVPYASVTTWLQDAAAASSACTCSLERAISCALLHGRTFIVHTPKLRCLWSMRALFLQSNSAQARGTYDAIGWLSCDLLLSHCHTYFPITADPVISYSQPGQKWAWRCCSKYFPGKYFV